MATQSPSTTTTTTGVSIETATPAATGHGTTSIVNTPTINSSSPSTSASIPSHRKQTQDQTVHPGSNNDDDKTTSFEMSEIDKARQQQVVDGSSGDAVSRTNNSESIPPVDTTSKPQNPIDAADSTGVAAAPATTSTTTTTSPEQPKDTSDQPPPISRLDSVAIGEATEVLPIVAPSETTPTLIITLLLTTGARHPYKIDEKYLTKRNVTVPGLTEDGKKDPLSVSVYTLKELILREWREEWEVAPSSPSSIRLIFFGRLLDDSVPLKDCRFNTETANVVHMTVRPQDIVDDEEAAKGKSGPTTRGDGEDTAGCRCVIL